MLVAMFVSETVAPVTPAPEGSETVPEMVPVTVCAKAARLQKSTKRHSCEVRKKVCIGKNPQSKAEFILSLHRGRREQNDELLLAESKQVYFLPGFPGLRLA